MDTQLVPQQQDPFSEMERMDEQQVLDEIKGRAIESLVYEIRQGGQTVTGLSLAGVREVVRSMNASGKARMGISEREPIITETEDYFEVKAFAQDTQNGGGYWGIKRQSKKYEGGRTNQFALEQALAKAQRNALRGIIPEYFAKEMIDAFRQRGKAQVIDGKQIQQAQRSAPVPQPTQAKPVSQAKVKTAQWQSAVKEIGALPFYQKNGGIDTWHILGSAEKLGYAEINDTNINEVKLVLMEHAKAEVAMAQEGAVTA